MAHHEDDVGPTGDGPVFVGLQVVSEEPFTVEVDGPTGTQTRDGFGLWVSPDMAQDPYLDQMPPTYKSYGQRWYYLTPGVI